MLVKMFRAMFEQPMSALEIQEAKMEFGREMNEDAEFVSINEKRAEKTRAAIAAMGEKWVLHQSHAVKKNNRPPSVLGSKVV